MPRCLPIMTPFLNRFCIDFYSQLRSPEPSKSLFFEWKTRLKKIALRSWDRFLIDSGANMLPFFLQKSLKFLPKIDSKMHHFFDRFWHRFLSDFDSILEANLEPCWPLFRSKYGGRIWRMGGWCWVYLLFRFFGRPGPLLAPSGLDLGGFGPPFWRFWCPSSSQFPSFLHPLFQQPWPYVKASSQLKSGLWWAGGVTRSANNLQF